MIKNIYRQIYKLGERQTGPELAHLNVAYHSFLVERQAYKSPILLVLHTNIATAFLVTFIGFVVTTVFTIAYLRIFDSFEQFSTQKIAGENIPHAWTIAVI